MTNTPHISVAPMMDWTDRHCRYFHRLIAPSVRLYTEMVTTGALIHGDRDRHLRFDHSEHPIALQLGGSEPDDLATCAKMAEDYGYDEINLNCGCPSERVQKGAFGACLMREPDLVADCVAAMQAAVKVPVTVKCRIGIDDSIDYDFLKVFIEKTSATNCNSFIIHARKAWLKGLSPKENREIPPLRYDIAARLKSEHPELTIIVNGGITTLDAVRDHLGTFDGVMIGREAYHNPWFLRDLETAFYGTTGLPDKTDIIRAMIPYAEAQKRDHGTPVKSIARHLLNLFNGQRGAREYRRILSTETVDLDSPPRVFEKALAAIGA